ncbi:MAG: DUF1287 domain-containing protein [Xanthomonadales bacterium]|nr:DUF1287 domain-containing protein [Xanthomonadales bacterium]
MTERGVAARTPGGGQHRCKASPLPTRRAVRTLPIRLLLLFAAGFASADAGEAERARIRVAWAALDQVGLTRSYDPGYRPLDYPGGDVPIDTGVCADVVVRALRGIGVDLQREVHEDMRAHFAAYPQRWRLTRPDRNIDHRRVPNLRRWFERRGWSLAVSRRGRDYLPGDIVSWQLPGNLAHIGVVSTRFSPDRRQRLVVHNIAAGAVEEDVLFAWPIDGHYRLPEAAASR